MLALHQNNPDLITPKILARLSDTHKGILRLIQSNHLKSLIENVLKRDCSALDCELIVRSISQIVSDESGKLWFLEDSSRVCLITLLQNRYMLEEARAMLAFTISIIAEDNQGHKIIMENRCIIDMLITLGDNQFSELERHAVAKAIAAIVYRQNDNMENEQLKKMEQLIAYFDTQNNTPNGKSFIDAAKNFFST